MTLGEFRKLTAPMPDFCPLLIPFHDHSYQIGDAKILTVTNEGRHGYSEHHETEELQPGQNLMRAVVIE